MPISLNLFSRNPGSGPGYSRRRVRWIVASIAALFALAIIVGIVQSVLAIPEPPVAAYRPAYPDWYFVEMNESTNELFVFSRDFGRKGQPRAISIEFVALNTLQKHEMLSATNNSPAALEWLNRANSDENSASWYAGRGVDLVVFVDDEFLVLDRTSFTERYRLKAPNFRLRGFAVSPDGNRMAAWDNRTGRRVRFDDEEDVDKSAIRIGNIKARSGLVSLAIPNVDRLCFTADSQQMVVLDDSGWLSLWNADGTRDGKPWSLDQQVGDELPSVRGFDESTCLRCSNGGALVAISTSDGYVRICDLKSRTTVNRFRAHQEMSPYESALCFLWSDAQLITTGHRCTMWPVRCESFPYVEIANVRISEIKVWDVNSGECARQWSFGEPVSWMFAIPHTNDFLAEFQSEGIKRLRVK